MADYQKEVLCVVRWIPRGNVMSYGQVAAYVGAPKAAREIGWAMNALGQVDNFPWWRVLNNAGQISIKDNATATADMQRQLLEQEGVKLSADLKLDMEHYRYRADATTLKDFGLEPDYIAEVIAKFEKPRQIPLFGSG